VITNSYILCLHCSDLRENGIKDFRCTLAKQLIGDYHSRKRPGRPSTRPQPKGSASNTFQLKEMTNHTVITTAIVTGMSVDVQYGGARIVRSSSATGKYDDFPATSEVGQVAKEINKSSNWVILPNHHKHESSTWSPQITARIFQVSYLSCEPNRTPVILPRCCRQVCADTWYCQDDKACTCPMCRAERAYSDTTPLQGLDDLLKGIGPVLGREPPAD